jgi:hypothetical protein
MAPTPDPNLAQLEQAAARLGDLRDELTLVGGCAAGLLITDPGAAGVRPTFDVDLVVEATTYVEYERFGRRLEHVGFQRSTGLEDPLCRWHLGSLVLDVMPLDEKVLGFSNRWYASAIRSRITRELPGGATIHLIDAPHFLASKLEAFSSRGAGDPLSSHDLEDLIRVFDGRAGIEQDLAEASSALRRHVRSSLADCMADRFFVEALPGYFPTHEEGDARARLLLARLRGFLGSGSS